MTNPLAIPSYPGDPTLPSQSPLGYVTPNSITQQSQPPMSSEQISALRNNFIEMLMRVVVQALTGVFLPNQGSGFDQLQSWATTIPGLSDIMGMFNSILGPIFGGIDFGSPPSPETLWPSLITTFMLPSNLLLGPDSSLITDLQGGLSGLTSGFGGLQTDFGSLLNNLFDGATGSTGSTGKTPGNVLSAFQGLFDGGGLKLSKVPSLPTSQITSGTFSQSMVAGLPDLSIGFGQITDILSGLTVTPANSQIGDIMDWFTGLTGKTQNLTTGGILPSTNVGSAIGGTSLGGDLLSTLNRLWDGFKGTSGSTGKTPADVQAAAAATSSAVTAAQQTTDSLTSYFAAPRLLPAWIGGAADDVAFDTDRIDGTTAPSLGQIVLIPVRIVQDRVADAIKIGLAATTMTYCYVGLYSCDLSTGGLTKVLDLGNCKAQIDTAYSEQTFAIPTPISVQRGELYYVGVLQVGGTAVAMHRSSATTNFTRGQYPRYRGNVHATGSQTALPSSIAVGNVTSGTRFWGAIGTANEAVTPGSIYLSDSFNRANASTLGASWSTRAGTSMRISSNTAVRASTFGSTSAMTHNTRLGALSQEVGADLDVQYDFVAGPANAGVLMLTLRGSGTGASVNARILTGSGGISIVTSTAYGAGSLTSRATAAGGSSGFYVFQANGTLYELFKDGVSILTWNDTGGAFPVGSSNTEIGIYCNYNMSGSFDNFYAKDL